MANLNKVLLMGNLTRDPELRYTPNGTPICEFGMAVNRRYTTKEGEKRDETLFVDVAMWGRRGVVISEYFTKGKPIFIEGRLKLDTWETADGRRSKITVVAENFEFVGQGGGGGQADRQAPGAQQRRGGKERGAGGEERGAGGEERRQAPKESEAEPTEREGFDVSDDEIPF